jgi:hypothetical protein
MSRRFYLKLSETFETISNKIFFTAISVPVIFYTTICYKLKDWSELDWKSHTVRKMDLILRSIQRRPQMQFSMARKFTLQDYADMT